MRPHTLALRRLRRWRPEALRRVTDRLHALGGRAYIVGGIVRDAFLNRAGADWDVATDLEPPMVANAFRHVVRAGEKHGTIMVIQDGTPIEVTTFRGEGPYLDGRRPSFVEFHGDLERDLARRDFTMNAIAVDLDAPEWVDPFGGVAAIERRVIACVGNARERFREDGLRPLRGVRFVSTLEFDIEAETRAALGAELETFERVAWERKRVEMEKLLLGPGVVRAIGLLRESGLLRALAPELAERDVALAVLPRLPAQPWLRLTAWAEAAGLDVEQVTVVLQRFKASVEIQRRVAAWLGALRAVRAPPTEGVELRRWLSRVGIEGARGAVEIWKADGRLDGRTTARLRRCLRKPPAHRVADLAISGRDLTRLGLEGPDVGQVLGLLLEQVLEEPRRNRRERLLAAAHRLSTSSTSPRDG